MQLSLRVYDNDWRLVGYNELASEWTKNSVVQFLRHWFRVTVGPLVLHFRVMYLTIYGSQ